MLKKELRDILKPAMTVMLVFILFFLAYKIFPGLLGNEIQELSKKLGISKSVDLYLLALILTIVAGSLGAGTFKSEYRDDAFEYLFSSPVPVSKIILFKIIPRLMILFGFLIIYILIFMSHSHSEINHIL